MNRKAILMAAIVAVSLLGVAAAAPASTSFPSDWGAIQEETTAANNNLSGTAGVYVNHSGSYYNYTTDHATSENFTFTTDADYVYINASNISVTTVDDLSLSSNASVSSYYTNSSASGQTFVGVNTTTDGRVEVTLTEDTNPVSDTVEVAGDNVNVNVDDEIDETTTVTLEENTDSTFSVRLNNTNESATNTTIAIATSEMNVTNVSELSATLEDVNSSTVSDVDFNVTTYNGQDYVVFTVDSWSEKVFTLGGASGGGSGGLLGSLSQVLFTIPFIGFDVTILIALIVILVAMVAVGGGWYYVKEFQATVETEFIN